MRDLIEKLRAATGPDRELDIAIWRLFDERGQSAPLDHVPLPWLVLYTSRIDHALTLVPEGLTWALASREPQDMAPTPWAVIGDKERALGEGIGATPAIALCIAALLAQEARDVSV